MHCRKERVAGSAERAIVSLWKAKVPFQDIPVLLIAET
jgi:hypothetical protein